MIRFENVQRRYVSDEGHADFARRRIDMLDGRIVASAQRAI